MHFGDISQLLALAVLGGTALAYSPAGDHIAGLAARNFGGGSKVLPRRDPPPRFDTQPWDTPWGAWDDDIFVAPGDAVERAGRRTRHGKIRPRQAATDGGAKVLSPRHDPGYKPPKWPYPDGTWRGGNGGDRDDNGNGGGNNENYNHAGRNARQNIHF
ncbi:hypothetical protein MCOR25_010269 [Pyricularia grisea]|uniref:Uncharacterized protein n=1 Tax=Pyricularia grisea TaxID=148305 RepID=A0A6P8B3B3_PYRGI|nr:uncharacterized protein PgNI_07834 [Pyricularia grisea]KAI6350950.1 hypothetical protein MCOR25_010269 [Pyricularia grisea]TLD09183.1 hypothetical protein PgNI_07834 [Pyricularia grisea]